MVRRLVQGQEVVRLQHQSGHRQACPLPATQHTHPLVDVLPAEEDVEMQKSNNEGDPSPEIPTRTIVTKDSEGNISEEVAALYRS